MIPPVRVVCNECLRSLEVEPDEAGRLPALCPVCGGTIDSHLSELETPTTNFVLPSPGKDSGAEEGPLWNNAWAKGSLGAIGRFQLRDVLGDGGFGKVYKAYDPRLDRDVVLKVLKQQNPGERVMERFFREGRAVARLEHLSIVAVHDAGTDDDRCWIAFQYVEGRTLARYAAQQPKPDIATAARIVRDLADALAHAHDRGVYHRDLKPANVILDMTGRPHLIDFGLSRRADLESGLTRDGCILGTPGYLPPEQADGRSSQADERSDIYSLGVVFYELLCGQRPTDLPSGTPPWGAIPGNLPPLARVSNKAVPVALERICQRAMAIDPAHRYPNARAFAGDLDRWLKTHQTRLSQPLTSILMGIAGSLLLVVALQAIFNLLPGESPSARSAANPDRTGPSANALLDSRKDGGGTASESANPVDLNEIVVNIPGLKVFHREGCIHLVRSPKFERMTRAEAEQLELTPCKHCFKKL
jgi:serine/threonine protein kinase